MGLLQSDFPVRVGILGAQPRISADKPNLFGFMLRVWRRRFKVLGHLISGFQWARFASR